MNTEAQYRALFAALVAADDQLRAARANAADHTTLIHLAEHQRETIIEAMRALYDAPEGLPFVTGGDR